MLSFVTWMLPTSYLPGWLTLDTNPVDCLLQGEPLIHSFLITPSSYRLTLYVFVPFRADRCLWDLGAMLPNEAAPLPRGAQVTWTDFLNKPNQCAAS